MRYKVSFETQSKQGVHGVHSFILRTKLLNELFDAMARGIFPPVRIETLPDHGEAETDLVQAIRGLKSVLGGLN